MTLREFLDCDFLPLVRSAFAAQPRKRAYYEKLASHLLSFEQLADERLDAITTGTLAKYLSKRPETPETKGRHWDPSEVASVKLDLKALEHLFALAQQWGEAKQAAKALLSRIGQ